MFVYIIGYSSSEHRLGYSDEQLGDKRPNHRT